MRILLFIAFLAVCVLARPTRVTARPDLCIGMYSPLSFSLSLSFFVFSSFFSSRSLGRHGSSKRLAKLVSKRPELFFRASRAACWHPHPPRDGDEVVVDFSRSKLASDGRFFTLDQAVVYERLTVLGPRWRNRKALRLHSILRVTAHVEVVHNVQMPRYSALFLSGSKARVTAGGVFLDGATLMGNGKVHADQFMATKGSFISPGRTLVSRCGARCFGLPRKFGGVQYGSLTLLTKDEADISGATIVIKHMGEHVSFKKGPSDHFAANLASPPAGAILILGDAAVSVPKDTHHVGPYNLVAFPASAYPSDPTSAICIASGSGGLDYSPESDRCRRFMLSQTSPAVFHPDPDTNPIVRWVHRFDSLKTLAAVQNIVPFKIQDCCKELIHRSFVSRRIMHRLSGHRRFMVQLDQTQFLHQMHVDHKLMALAPLAIQHHAQTITPTTKPAPLLPNSLKVTKSCFFCYANPAPPQVESKCVATTTMHPSDACCPPGFSGTGCTEPISCTCSQHGQCEEEGGNCKCDPGFQGYDCSVPLCPTSNGVQCTGPAFGSCITTPNDPEAVPFCNCTTGFAGAACELPVCESGMCSRHARCFTNGGAPTCWEKDSLAVASCDNGGKLTKGGCECKSGFEGPRCQSPLCHNRCSKAGLCSLVNGSPVCKCAKGYTGSDCSKQTCHADRCHNGGLCLMRAGFADCSCAQGWSGLTCEERTTTVNRNSGVYASHALHDGAILLGIMGATFIVASIVVGAVFFRTQRKAARHEKDMQRRESQQIDPSM